MPIKTENILLLDRKELNDLNKYQQQFQSSSDPNKYFFLVACGFRNLQESDFPDGSVSIRFTIPKDTVALDQEDAEQIRKAAEELLQGSLPSKNEFTKLSTSDGKLVYVCKSSPNHNSTVARILEEWAMEEVRPDIQAASKEDCMPVRTDS